MERLEQIKNHPLVGDVRGRGMLGAIELVSDKKTKRGFDGDLDIGGRLSRLTWESGVIVRCFVNGVIGFAPALCCTESEMDLIIDRVEQALDRLLEMKDIRSIMA